VDYWQDSVQLSYFFHEKSRVMMPDGPLGRYVLPADIGAEGRDFIIKKARFAVLPLALAKVKDGMLVTDDPIVRNIDVERALGRGGADVIVLAPSGTPLAELATVLIPIDLVFNTDPYTPILARLAYLVVIDILAVGLALQRGPEFRKKIQNAQKTLQEFDMQFDSFIG
jgi:hypothetical protein